MRSSKILNQVSMDTKLSFGSKIRRIGVVDIIYMKIPLDPRDQLPLSFHFSSAETAAAYRLLGTPPGERRWD